MIDGRDIACQIYYILEPKSIIFYIGVCPIFYFACSYSVSLKLSDLDMVAFMKNTANKCKTDRELWDSARLIYNFQNRSRIITLFPRVFWYILSTSKKETAQNH